MKAKFCGLFLTGVLVILASNSESQGQFGIWIGGRRGVVVGPPPVAVYGGYYAPYGYAAPYMPYIPPAAPVDSVPFAPAPVYPYGWYTPAPFWNFDSDD